jgi:chromosome segregation ATPase
MMQFISDLRRELQQHHTRAYDALFNANKVRTDLEDELGIANSKYKQDISIRDARYTKLYSDYCALWEEKKGFEAKAQQLQAQLGELLAEKQLAEKQAAERQLQGVTTKPTEIPELQGSKTGSIISNSPKSTSDELHEEIYALTSEIESANRVIADLKGNIGYLQDRITQLQAENANLTECLEDEQEKNRELGGEKKSLEDKLESIRKVLVEKYPEESDNLDALLFALTNDDSRAGTKRKQRKLGR